MNKEFDTLLSEFEKEIGVPQKFFSNLFKEDNDWAFIIKLHSFLEGAVSNLLKNVSNVCFGKLTIEEYSDVDFGEVFSWLELGDKKKGKVAFLKASNLLRENERKYLLELSELRNKLVHDITNANFNLKEYYFGLDKNQKKNFVDRFGYIVKNEFNIDNQKVTKTQLIEINPRYVIFLGAHKVLHSIVYCMQYFNSMKKVVVVDEKLLETHENIIQQQQETMAEQNSLLEKYQSLMSFIIEKHKEN